MTAPIITIAQQKGGAGKTTIAAHVAQCMAASGKAVACLDIDPQGSLAMWGRLRAEAGIAPPVPVSAVSGWKVENEAKSMARNHDLLVIDSAPHAQTEAKAAIRLSTLVLIPIQPSPMDLWATEPTIKLAREARVPILLLLNRVPPRARIADLLVAEAEKLGVPLAATRLGNRVAYAEAMMQGQCAQELSRSSAAAKDMAALSDELTHHLAEQVAA